MSGCPTTTWQASSTKCLSASIWTISCASTQYALRRTRLGAHHPVVLLGLLIYGYACGVHSSRKIERATYESVAFHFVAANTHPDHDTLATIRRRFLKEVEALFVQVLAEIVERPDQPIADYGRAAAASPGTARST